MEVNIRGRKVPEAVRSAAHDKVSRLARFLDGWDHAEVHFIEERNPRIPDREVCEVTLSGHGRLLRAKAASPDAFAAVDLVVDKLEHQVEKLKGRLISRSHPRRHLGAASLPHDDGDEGDPGPEIIRVKRAEAKPMTPEEAALQMDVLAYEFLFFTNAETGQAALVYRRNDGHVGLIDGAD